MRENSKKYSWMIDFLHLNWNREFLCKTTIELPGSSGLHLSGWGKTQTELTRVL